MTEPQFDITPFLDQDEGQHFDRKSLFEGASGTKQLRDRRAVQRQGMAESWESRPSDSKLDGLDDQLLAKARQGAGLSSLSDEEYLLRRKLADRRGREIVLRKAAELLFARLGPDHPNAGVRLFRVIGTEHRTGPEHNVEERPRMEGNLPAVIEEASGVISSLLRRPSRLVGNQFREVPEYPDFA